MKTNRNDFDEFVNKHGCIYIYGSGHYGMAIHSLLLRNSIGNKLKGFIVSERRKSSCNGLPIFITNEIETDIDIGIIVAMKEENSKVVYSQLISEGRNEIFVLSKEFLRSLDSSEYELNYQIDQKNSGSVLNPKYNSPSIIGSKNFLIIKLDGIGDAILCTPFVRELRKNHPSSIISIICTPITYSIWENCPYIDECVIFDGESIATIPTLFVIKECESFIKNNFGNRIFDVAIVPRFDADYYLAGFLAYCSKAKKRYSYSESVTKRKTFENKNFDKLYTGVLDVSTPAHEVRKNIDLLMWLGDKINSDELEVWDNAESVKHVNMLMDDFLQLKELSIVAIGMSGSSKKKRWVFSNYIELARVLYQWNNKLVFVLLGDEMCKKDLSNSGLIIKEDERYIINLTGDLSLKDSMSLLKKTIMYIGNDTGIMHIAAACKNMIVELNHAAEPIADDSEYGNLRFVPWKTPYIVLRPIRNNDFDYKDNDTVIDSITVAQAADAAKELLCKNMLIYT